MTHSLDRFAYTLSTELCAEIQRLVRERKMLIEALEFYASKSSWIGDEINEDGFQICITIMSDFEKFCLEDDKFLMGGKLAREALKSIEGKS